MNELLQSHGCSNVFTVPEGLKELMSDISREVLRKQPTNIFDFIANYLSVLIITREHGIMAVKILEDLCDCRPTVSEHLMQLGMEKDQADFMASVIKEQIEGAEPVEGKEGVKEIQIIKIILTKQVLDEDMAAKVCQVSRNAYRDYWYRKKLLEKNLKSQPEEPWEKAVQHTLEIYKKTKPSFSELSRATQVIQAAYRGYHVRRNLLGYLKPAKKQGPKVDLHGPPIDIAESREINLGPIIDIKVKEDDFTGLFAEKHVGEKVGLTYDPTKTITHIIEDNESVLDETVVTGLPSISKTVDVKTSSHQSIHKISFSVAKDIPDTTTVEGSVTPISYQLYEHTDITEIDMTEGTEATTDIIEDIQGERTDVDGDSAPAMSVSSSAPDTTNTTDVEDVPEDTDAEEEE